jgi:hypothetical protein
MIFTCGTNHKSVQGCMMLWGFERLSGVPPSFSDRAERMRHKMSTLAKRSTRTTSLRGRYVTDR